jgi:hypothetical protein
VTKASRAVAIRYLKARTVEKRTAGIFRTHVRARALKKHKPQMRGEDEFNLAYAFARQRREKKARTHGAHLK